MSHHSEIVRYTYRLRPGATAEAALIQEWHRCRWLWNEAVHQQRTGRRPTFGKLSKLLTQTRTRTPWLGQGSQDAQQQMLRTYAQALNHSFTVKGRGRPKAKKRKGSRVSLSYSRNGFAIEDGRLRLRLPKGLTVPVVWSRELPSAPTSVGVYQDSLGHWYASFVVRRVVASHQVIAVEDFRPKFLAKSTMARKAADAAIATVKATLIEYAQRAGRQVVMVQPAYTSMTCSRCGTRAKDRLMLDERTFVCTTCALIADRDVNAARVILAVAERGHTSVEGIRHPGPPFQVVSGAA